jgi:hypothetical protein
MTIERNHPCVKVPVAPLLYLVVEKSLAKDSEKPQ